MLDEALSPNLQLPESSLSSLRMTLAAVHMEADELDESLAIYREITPLIVARGDLAAHGLVLHNTGVAHLRRGDIYTGLSSDPTDARGIATLVTSRSVVASVIAVRRPQEPMRGYGASTLGGTIEWPSDREVDPHQTKDEPSPDDTPGSDQTTGK